MRMLVLGFFSWILARFQFPFVQATPYAVKDASAIARFSAVFLLSSQ